jgi:type 1 glutamine amidotransferase
MRTTSAFVISFGSLVLLAAACGGDTIDQINLTGGTSGAGGSGVMMGGTGGGMMGGTGGTTGGTGGAGGSTGGGAGTGGSVTAGSSGGPPATGGTGGSTGGSAGVGGVAGAATGGSAGTYPSAGTAGTSPMGGAAGTIGDPSGGTAGTGSTAGTGGGCEGPYCPRTGSFKVLAYFKTGGFTHTEAINAGKTMLMSMGTKQGFEVAFSDNPSDVNADNLAQYEVFFGLNPTGDNLSSAQKAAFEEWMTTKNGAFAGVHSSTDHEAQWAFWHEVTGQYYQRHDQGTFTTQSIQWQPGTENYVFVKGLPSPWSRAEEWYHFDSYSTWSQKPGFKVLNLVTTSQGGTRPVSFIREWGNFRSFYTSLGHNGNNYSEATFVRHVGAGIMWAARREALFME